MHVISTPISFSLSKMMNIYTWGNGKEISPFDIESIILSQLINDIDDIQIIPNSNYFISNSQKLPCLITNDEQITGLINIWNYLSPDDNNDSTERLLFDSLLHSIIKNFNIITTYNYFVNTTNYESFTRPAFKNYLPWPFQYLPPLQIRENGIEDCMNLGIIDGENDGNSTLDDEEKHLVETPVINDLQKNQIDNNLQLINKKKSIISNLNCIQLLKSTIDNFNQLKEKLSTSNSEFLSLIINSYLQNNIIDELSDNFIKITLERDYPEYLNTKSLPKSYNPSHLTFSNAFKSFISSFI